MSLSRYAAICAATYFTLFLAIASLGGLPFVDDSNWVEVLLVAMFFGICGGLGAACLATVTPVEKRNAFWSFKFANWVSFFPATVAGTLGILLLIVKAF